MTSLEKTTSRPHRRAPRGRLSIVIPVYRGEKTIAGVVSRCLKTLREWNPQIVLVNDASPDDSHRVCLELQRKNRGKVVYARLARNCGEHNAVMAGLRLTTGDCVLVMDDDDQNDPADVKGMWERLHQGDLDVVFGKYRTKKHAWWRNLGSRFNDLAASALMGKPKDLYLCSFKIMSRFVVNEILRYDGPYPYLDGLILRSTNRLASVWVSHQSRAQGKSGYTLRKLIRLWLAMATNFSILPLRAAAVLGWVIALVAFIGGTVIVSLRLANAYEVPGWTSLFALTTFLAGVQLLSLGLLGEYIGRLFLSSNKTPQAPVREVYR